MTTFGGYLSYYLPTVSLSTLWLATGISLGVAYCLFFVDPPPLLGRYSKPGKWYRLKYWLIYTYLKLRARGLFQAAGGAGYGKRSREAGSLIDVPQTLSDHPLAIDATYFNGYNSDGFYFGAGIQRRPQQKVETLLFIRVPNLGTLQWPFHPDTAANADKPDTFSTGGLRLEPVEPMKQWKLSFEGQLRLRAPMQLSDTPCHDYHSGDNEHLPETLTETDASNSEDHLKKVKLNFQWTAESDYFDFDTDMDIVAIATAIAKEPWSREFFEKLNRSHQTHTEQFGLLKGSLEIEGFGTQTIQLNSMHDHSYGFYRNWADFNRYILHYFAAEDGTRLGIHLVSIRDTLTYLWPGFIIDPDGNKLSIRECDTPIWEIGEHAGVFLRKWDFSMTTATGATYRLKVDVIDGTQVYCGWKWEAEINVRFCKATINDVPARGMVELEYRNYGGRRTKDCMSTAAMRTTASLI